MVGNLACDVVLLSVFPTKTGKLVKHDSTRTSAGWIEIPSHYCTMVKDLYEVISAPHELLDIFRSLKIN